MALTPEKIDEIAGPADYFDRRVFARAIESDVRKQDTELIRQMQEALGLARRLVLVGGASTHDEIDAMFTAASAANARLEGKPCD